MLEPLCEPEGSRQRLHALFADLVSAQVQRFDRGLADGLSQVLHTSICDPVATKIKLEHRVVEL